MKTLRFEKLIELNIVNIEVMQEAKNNNETLMTI